MAHVGPLDCLKHVAALGPFTVVAIAKCGHHVPIGSVSSKPSWTTSLLNIFHKVPAGISLHAVQGHRSLAVAFGQFGSQN